MTKNGRRTVQWKDYQLNCTCRNGTDAYFWSLYIADSMLCNYNSDHHQWFNMFPQKIIGES